MSVVRSQPPFGLAGLRMRADEYLAHGQMTERYELVSGVVVMSPSPVPRHWKVVQELILQLARFAEGGGAADVYAETDLMLNDLAVFRPDVCVYARRAPASIPSRLTEVPDLVAEVLSPGSEAMDLVTKRDEYEKSGVREYWVIDPADGRTRAWHLDRSKLIESLVEGTTLGSRAVPGFSLDLGKILRVLGRS